MINAIRVHFAEFGIVAPVGRNGVEELLGVVADLNDKRAAGITALGTHPRVFKAQNSWSSITDQRLASALFRARYM